MPPDAKGKARAVDVGSDDTEPPTESTPLLRAPPAPISFEQPSVQDPPPDSHSRRFRLLPFFCLFLFLSFGVLLALALAAYSRLRRDVNSNLDRSLQWRINDLRLLNVSNTEPISLWLSIKASFWLQLNHLPPWEKSLLDIGLRMANSVTLSPSFITVHHPINATCILSLSTPELTIPLPQSILNSQDADIIFQAIPTSDIPFLIHVAEQSWNISRVDTFAIAHNISFSLGSIWGKYTLADIRKPFTFDIPKFPFLPPPPSPLLPSIAAILHLYSMRLYPNRSVEAFATFPNPLPYFNLPPFHTSFTPNISGTVYLPPTNDSTTQDLLPVISGAPSEIFVSTETKNLTIPIHGILHKIPSTPTAEKQLSTFLSTFLSGRDSPIVISVLNKFLPFNFPGPNPRPKVLRNVHLSDMHFALKEKRAVVSGTLQVIIALPKGVNLTLEVKRATVDLIAFNGPVVLPEPPPPEDDDPDQGDPEDDEPDAFFPHIPFPRVPHMPTKLPKLPFPRIHSPFHRHDDGEDDGDIPSPPPHPLPDPLPPHAFARIRPAFWLNATSVLVDPSEEEPNPPSPDPAPGNTTDPDTDGDPPKVRYLVTAQFVHVPLEVIPGREPVFRNFIAKFVFRKQALAGVKGFAGVGVIAPGLLAEDEGSPRTHERGVLELLDLPFDGEVMVGRGKGEHK